GLYRLQRHDKRTIGMHWQIHKDSRNHYQVAARRLNDPMNGQWAAGGSAADGYQCAATAAWPGTKLMDSEGGSRPVPFIDRGRSRPAEGPQHDLWVGCRRSRVPAGRGRSGPPTRTRFATG
ncbi:UbiD family decarboxylase domain-containing protein, partial [Streptomyces sp. NPDC005568]|uniref:UbiD family decarboxylase domain-containing protein n=1 Tax=Streptomyces sp. NPDC005568 TaxID=3156887 RepID=UPI00339FF1F1